VNPILLIVDEDRLTREPMADYLRDHKFTVLEVDRIAAAEREIWAVPDAACLILSGSGAFTLALKLCEHGQKVPLVIMASYWLDGMETVISQRADCFRLVEKGMLAPKAFVAMLHELIREWEARTAGS
jgi:DNA-binding response OmpR family regulator